MNMRVGYLLSKLREPDTQLGNIPGPFVYSRAHRHSPLAIFKVVLLNICDGKG